MLQKKSIVFHLAAIFHLSTLFCHRSEIYRDKIFFLFKPGLFCENRMGLPSLIPTRTDTPIHTGLQCKQKQKTNTTSNGLFKLPHMGHMEHVLSPPLPAFAFYLFLIYIPPNYTSNQNRKNNLYRLFHISFCTPIYLKHLQTISIIFLCCSSVILLSGRQA